MLVLYVSFVKFDFGICIVGDFEEEKKDKIYAIANFSDVQFLNELEIKGTLIFQDIYPEYLFVYCSMAATNCSLMVFFVILQGNFC